MIRRFHDLRQYRHALRRFTWPHVESKKLVWAGAATVLALSGGATLLSLSDTSSPPQQNGTSVTNANSTHPLLGLGDTQNPISKEQESPTPQSESHQNTATQNARNEASQQTTVTINGESIEVPPSGSSHQTIKNPDGSSTEVDIKHDQTESDGTPRSNIIIDSQSRTKNSSTSLNSRITITH